MHPSQARNARSIPIARPLISEDEKRRVLEVVDSGMAVAGRQVAEFEQAFARYLCLPHAVATFSGTTVLQVAQEAGAVLNGECAQAHGARFRGRWVGACRPVSIRSVQPSKHVTTGEGGMVVSADPVLAARGRVLVSVGQSTGAEYTYEPIGY